MIDTGVSITLMQLRFCRPEFWSCLLRVNKLQVEPEEADLSVMFKPTQPLYKRLRRLALTTKQVNGGYYKGTGSGTMGQHTKYGGFVIDWRKVRTYIVPQDLKDFKVRKYAFSKAYH